MRKILLTLFLVLSANLLLIACASNTDAPAKAVENYLNALVEKDADRLSTLVCGAWEEDALIELDSFQAVTARLEGDKESSQRSPFKDRVRPLVSEVGAERTSFL